MITDSNGQVISRRDFMPFGEEIGASVGSRSEALKYSLTGADTIRKRFTGYEKDDETQLDFAEARMYQNKHGRFTAVDPLLASVNVLNPQTFNRYSYTGNNPINNTDPSGLCPSGGCSPYSGNVYYQTVGGTTQYYSSKCEGCTLYTGPDITFQDHDSGILTLVTRGGWQSLTSTEYAHLTGAEGVGTQDEVTTTVGTLGENITMRQSLSPVSADTEGNSSESDNSRSPINLGSGWQGRLDTFLSGETFEIHVYNPKGEEEGVVSGRYGWLEKHGHSGEPPSNIPRTTLNRINGLNVGELRARGMVQEKGFSNINPFKGGGYLFANRTIYGATNILGLMHGAFMDYEIYREGKRNGRSINEEYEERWKQNSDQRFIDTIIGPLPNPCYDGRCIKM